MAQRVERLSVPCAAKTNVGTPVVFAGGDGAVVAVEVRFPSGCGRFVGAQVFYGDAQVIPKTPTELLFGNDQVYHFDTSGYPTGTGWGALVSNDDIYAHTIAFTFELDDATVDTSEVDFPPLVLLPFDEQQIGRIIIPGVSDSIGGALTSPLISPAAVSVPGGGLL